MVEFIYNGQKYTCADLDIKLKRMKISRDDVQILEKPKEPVEMNDTPKYYFYNSKTKETIVSIYDSIRNIIPANELQDWRKLDGKHSTKED